MLIWTLSPATYSRFLKLSMNLSQNYLNFFLPQFSLSSESLKIAIRYEEAGSNIQSLHKHILHSNTP
jgi:hypothetical protein